MWTAGRPVIHIEPCICNLYRLSPIIINCRNNEQIDRFLLIPQEFPSKKSHKRNPSCQHSKPTCLKSLAACCQSLMVLFHNLECGIRCCLFFFVLTYKGTSSENMSVGGVNPICH